MKRVLLIAALALSAAAPALAADLPPPMALPPRAPAAYVPVMPMFTWTGFYIGANAGYGFGQSDWTSPAGTTGNFNVTGPLAGGTVGYNYQIGQFVVGFEGDFDWQNVRGTLVGGNCNLGPGAPASCDTSSNWIGTFRGRFGYAMDRVLLFATAGGAVTDIRASLNALNWQSTTELGWTAGAGIEYAITDNWTVKADYLFADFQKGSCGAANCLAVPTASVSFNENMVRAGVNFKFF